jgi:hypothetical protein
MTWTRFSARTAGTADRDRDHPLGTGTQRRPRSHDMHSYRSVCGHLRSTDALAPHARIRARHLNLAKPPDHAAFPDQGTHNNGALAGRRPSGPHSWCLPCRQLPERQRWRSCYADITLSLPCRPTCTPKGRWRLWNDGLGAGKIAGGWRMTFDAQVVDDRGHRTGFLEATGGRGGSGCRISTATALMVAQ